MFIPADLPLNEYSSAPIKRFCGRNQWWNCGRLEILQPDIPGLLTLVDSEMRVLVAPNNHFLEKRESILQEVAAPAVSRSCSRIKDRTLKAMAMCSC